MKKLLYVLPIVLLLMSLTTLHLYRDTLHYVMPIERVNEGAAAMQLKPSHWRLETDSYGRNPTITTDASDPDDYNSFERRENYHGFPFAAYYYYESDPEYQQRKTVAYSKLWMIIDGVIVLVAAGFAVYANRPKTARTKLASRI